MPKRQRRFCLAQAVALLLAAVSAAAPGVAQELSLSQRLGQLESTLGVHADANPSMVDRVGVLESKVFGAVGSGSLVDRVDRLRRAVFDRQAAGQTSAPTTPQAMPQPPALQQSAALTGSAAVGNDEIPLVNIA